MTMHAYIHVYTVIVVKTVSVHSLNYRVVGIYILCIHNYTCTYTVLRCPQILSMQTAAWAAGLHIVHGTARQTLIATGKLQYE